MRSLVRACCVLAAGAVGLAAIFALIRQGRTSTALCEFGYYVFVIGIVVTATERVLRPIIRRTRLYRSSARGRSTGRSGVSGPRTMQTPESQS